MRKHYQKHNILKERHNKPAHLRKHGAQDNIICVAKSGFPSLKIKHFIGTVDAFYYRQSPTLIHPIIAIICEIQFEHMI